MRYFLRLAYDGTRFHGWQRQPNALSVQQKLEEGLSTILSEPIEVVGAGRTDAGVHAREFYAHFDSRPIDNLEKFLSSLNKMVGKDIALYSLLRVKDDAHARFDALSRTYNYMITTVKNPFLTDYAHKIERVPDIELMNEAAQILLSTEDFTSFAKLHADTKTNICRLMKAQWTYDPSKNLLTFEIKADRFLRNMVRAVVGTLLKVGNHKATIEQFEEIIQKRDRCAAGVSMPANGLYLTEVAYPENIFIL